MTSKAARRLERIDCINCSLAENVSRFIGQTSGPIEENVATSLIVRLKVEARDSSDCSEGDDHLNCPSCQACVSAEASAATT